MLTELWVDRTDYRHTRVVRGDLPEPGAGEILVAIDKFAMTANNVTYAASGDLFGYWQFYPTGEDPWGKVTVWGIGEVIASQVDAIEVGERLYGFFPMSSHVVMTPGDVTARGFADAVAHRQPLPGLYNQYARTRAEPDELHALEDQRCIFFPLFMTGYVIADLLLDNDWFGVQQVVIGSASSKTGFGTAAFIRAAGFEGDIILDDPDFPITGARAYFSGGAGLSATAYDYFRFIQMLQNNGELDGVRILGRKSVELMRSARVDLAGNGKPDFGMGFQLTGDLGSAGEIGSPSAYAWGGAFNSTYWIDPEERLVAVFMSNVRPYDTDIRLRFRTAVYQALE